MIGKVATGTVTDINEQAYFVQIAGQTYALPKVEVTQEEAPQLGSRVAGFIYENKQKKRVMTQFWPVAGPDEYGWGKVTQTRRDLGAFVDIGLPDKDVVISEDDLPADANRWPRPGDQVLVRLETDFKERIWAKLADENIFEQLAQTFPDNLNNRNLHGTVYSSRPIGAFVITDDYYLAFVHSSQSYRPLRLGEQISARVIGTSQYGRLNLSVLPRSYEEIDDDAQMLLVSLQREATKTLPFSDASSPEEIKEHFGISKGAFKRAIGHLLKAHLISEDKEDGTISLLKQGED
ncbi:MAG: S1-like domain-containing RNA-binding protein [Lactobacillus sp.]|nr:S1-like domain-containing RNA-binding protein [Lactobacillus sp.]